MPGNSESKIKIQEDCDEVHDLSEKNESIPEIPSFTVGKSNFDKKQHFLLNLNVIQNSTTMFFGEGEQTSNSVLNNLFISPMDSFNKVSNENNMINLSYEHSMSNFMPVTPNKHSQSFDMKDIDVSAINENKQHINNQYSIANKEQSKSSSNNSWIDKSKYYINEFFGPLPQGARWKIQEFLLDEIGSQVHVSKAWNASIKKLIQFKTARLEIPFMKLYNSIQKWERSYVVLIGLNYKAKNKNVPKTYRLDKIFQAEVTPELVGKTITLSYKYCLNRKKSKYYWAYYKFDVIKKGNKRVTWVYQEQRKNSGSIVSQIRQPVIVVCAGDLISIYVNIWSPEGLVDLESIEWNILNITTSGTNINCEDPKYYDNERVCEVEAEAKWSQLPNDPRSQIFGKNLFGNVFERYDFKAYGLEFVLAKGYYKAVKPGCLSISDSKNPDKQSLSIIVKQAEEKLVHRLTRIGYVSEIDNSVRLRVGDKLIFYILNN